METFRDLNSEILPGSNNLNVAQFSQILSNKYLMNSYKLYWLAGIIEEIKAGNDVISFRKIVGWMVAKSWYSLLRFKLNLGYQDRLYVLVQYVFRISNLKETAKEEEIVSFIENSRDIELNRKITHFYSYVPNRLLSPFYASELKEIPEKSRSAYIVELSRKTPAFYKITDEHIHINNKWMDYISSNLPIIEGWIPSKLVMFLQKRNPSVPSIINKINAPQKRDMSRAVKFWKDIHSYKNIKNIYTDEELFLSDFSVDHFIPWSFVMHDHLWNLIPISKSTNSKKSDRIPSWERYFQNFSEMQYYAFTTAMENNFSSKRLEDYLNLKQVELVKGYPRDLFIKALDDLLKPTHQLALNQGFQLWEY